MDGPEDGMFSLVCGKVHSFGYCSMNSRGRVCEEGMSGFHIDEFEILYTIHVS